MFRNRKVLLFICAIQLSLVFEGSSLINVAKVKHDQAPTKIKYVKTKQDTEPIINANNNVNMEENLNKVADDLKDNSTTIKINDANILSENKKHILMFHPWGTKSHRGQQNILLLGLLKQGHSITGVFTEQSDIVHERYTEIVIQTR